mmetsp:Transcript_51866/g.52837  ORF Transcript_51866/g.52837 Transcript_51866/m.52837 type:complete len:86 (-) Transcript_51866:68-325(-)
MSPSVVSWKHALQVGRTQHPVHQVMFPLSHPVIWAPPPSHRTRESHKTKTIFTTLLYYCYPKLAIATTEIGDELPTDNTDAIMAV